MSKAFDTVVNANIALIFLEEKICLLFLLFSSTTSVAPRIKYQSINQSIKFISTFIHHYMSIIIIIIHCIFLDEKSKRICRRLNKLIRDIPGITHNQFT